MWCIARLAWLSMQREEHKAPRLHVQGAEGPEEAEVQLAAQLGQLRLEQVGRGGGRGGVGEDGRS